ncbi:MAG: response regulator transcription factor [Lachnospiraceae bacterium]|nr:response regulator transcription factor [Lachnospiraceae bacterium]
MYKIAICDNNKNYIEFLKKIIIDTGVISKDKLLFCDFNSGDQLLCSQSLDFDLVIMDLKLKKMGGFETAMKLRKIDRNFVLVFCSGVVRPEIDHFKAGVYRYLLKNFTNDQMVREMAEVMKEVKRTKEIPYVLCKYSSGKDQIKVSADDILYIAIRNNASEVFACGKIKEQFPYETLRVNMRLNEISQIFNEEAGFARAHNSYIINMAYITVINSDSVKLVDETMLPISRSKSKEFHQAFAKFSGAKYRA